MQAYWVIKSVDVAGDSDVSLLFSLVGMGDFLVLERSEETLGHGVVPAVCFSAHALDKAMCGEAAREFGAGILAAAIGMQ